MDWKDTEADWERIKGQLRLRWSRLADEDLEGIAGMAGKREHLIGRLRKIYGLSKERVEAELRDWERHQEPIAPIGLAE